jgi:hypothetical protein
MNLKENEPDNQLHFTGYFAKPEHIVNLHDDILDYQKQQQEKQVLDEPDEHMMMENIFQGLDERTAALSLNERQIQGQETKLALLSLIIGCSGVSLATTAITMALPHIQGYHLMWNLTLVPVLFLVSIASGYFWSNTIFNVWQSKNRFLKRLKKVQHHLTEELNAFKLDHGL